MRASLTTSDSHLTGQEAGVVIQCAAELRERMVQHVTARPFGKARISTSFVFLFLKIDTSFLCVGIGKCHVLLDDSYFA